MVDRLVKFRKAFKVLDKDALKWFPGHMAEGMKDIQRKLLNIDCIIEVHDARIPFSGRNPTFKSSICGIKPHILVLSKRDLTDQQYNGKVTAVLKEQQEIEHVVYANCRDQNCKGLKKLFPLMQDLVKQSNRYHRAQVKEHTLLIIGVPNVGKSSLINMLRSKHTDRGKGTAVGAVAGITRSVLNRIKVSLDPPIYMMDTPGILTPEVSDPEGGMKLALCAALLDHIVGPENIADYLIYHMNKSGNYKYVDLLGLKEPSDNVTRILTEGAVHLNRYKKMRWIDGRPKMYPDFLYTANHLINAYRTGLFGPSFLDHDVLQKLTTATEE